MEAFKEFVQGYEMDDSLCSLITLGLVMFSLGISVSAMFC